MTFASTKSHDASAENRGVEPHGSDPRDEGRIQKQLANAIYEHRVKPGTKLPELDLCGIYSTTRGVIRKVLDRLASEQLVDLIPNRGAFVARPSVELTRDTYSLRRILEAGVVRTLAKNAKRPWLRDVRLQVGEEREANRVGDTGRYIRLAGKFHLDLATATGNSALEQHLKRVVSQTSLMTALYDVPGTNTCSVHEHLEILDAIEAGDYANAERLMEDHLIGCERQLRLDPEDALGLDLAQALGAATNLAAPVPSPARKVAVRKPLALATAIAPTKTSRKQTSAKPTAPKTALSKSESAPRRKTGKK